MKSPLPPKGTELVYRAIAGGDHRAVVVAVGTEHLDLDVYLPGANEPAISLGRVPFFPTDPGPGRVRVCFPTP